MDQIDFACGLRAYATPDRWLAYYPVSMDRHGYPGDGGKLGAVIVAEFVEVEIRRHTDRHRLDAALTQTRAEKPVIAVAESTVLSPVAGSC